MERTCNGEPNRAAGACFCSQLFNLSKRVKCTAYDSLLYGIHICSIRIFYSACNFFYFIWSKTDYCAHSRSMTFIGSGNFFADSLHYLATLTHDAYHALKRKHARSIQRRKFSKRKPHRRRRNNSLFLERCHNCKRSCCYGKL